MTQRQCKLDQTSDQQTCFQTGFRSYEVCIVMYKKERLSSFSIQLNSHPSKRSKHPALPSATAMPLHVILYQVSLRRKSTHFVAFPDSCIARPGMTTLCNPDVDAYDLHAFLHRHWPPPLVLPAACYLYWVDQTLSITNLSTLTDFSADMGQILESESPAGHGETLHRPLSFHWLIPCFRSQSCSCKFTTPARQSLGPFFPHDWSLSLQGLWRGRETIEMEVDVCAVTRRDSEHDVLLFRISGLETYPSILINLRSPPKYLA